MRVWDAPQHIFNYAFDEVASIFYNRYPNSFAGHILSEDVLTREITKDRIISRKLIVKNGLSDLFFCALNLLGLGSSFLKSMPRWISKLTFVQYVPIIEGAAAH